MESSSHIITETSRGYNSRGEGFETQAPRGEVLGSEKRLEGVDSKIGMLGGSSEKPPVKQTEELDDPYITVRRSSSQETRL